MVSAPSTRQGSAQVPTAPYSVLPPRMRWWPIVLATGFLVTVAAAAWSAITGDLSVRLVCWLGAVGTVAGLLPVVRSDLRHSRLDKALEQLAPVLGFRVLTRSKVRVHRWSGLVRGAPRTVVVHYARPVRDTDPSWKAEIVSTVAHVFHAEYVVRRHNDLRCRMVLRRVDTHKGETAVDTHDEAPERVRKLVTELLGESSTITRTELDAAGELRAVEVHEPTDTRLVSPAYRRRIERIWSTMMPGRWRARFELADDKVRLELRPSFPDSVWLPVPSAEPPRDPRTGYERTSVSYAIDEDGRTVVWRPAERPNLLLVGVPGTGRTSTTRAVLLQLARAGWPCFVLDDDDEDFGGLRDWPNVQLVASRVEEQVAAVHRAHTTMATRTALVADGLADPQDFEPLLVVIGDWAQFDESVSAWYATLHAAGGRAPVLQRIRDLARSGASVRIHLVVGSDRPESEHLADGIRELYGERAALGRLTADGAMLMWRSSTTGVATPRNYPGRGTGVCGDGSGVEIQAYQIPDPVDVESGSVQADLIRALRPDRARHQRLVMVPADDGLDGEDAPPITYTCTEQALWVDATDRPDLDPARSDAAWCRIPEEGTGGAIANPEAAEVGQLAARAPFAPYAEPENVCITDVRPGDLVLVDESAAAWATATDPPEPDVIDGDLWCLEWRSDDDEDGTVQAGEDEFLVVRRPLDEGGAARDEGSVREPAG